TSTSTCRIGLPSPDTDSVSPGPAELAVQQTGLPSESWGGSYALTAADCCAPSCAGGEGESTTGLGHSGNGGSQRNVRVPGVGCLFWWVVCLCVVMSACAWGRPGSLSRHPVVRRPRLMSRAFPFRGRVRR